MPWKIDDLVSDIDGDTYAVDQCPVCGTSETVPPTGDHKSPVLIVGDSPGTEEIDRGRAFVGPTGRILSQELSHKGYRLQDFRVMNMWQHAPNKNQECFEHGVKTVMQEAKGKKIIALIGADTVKYFTNKKVSDWNGLTTTSELLGEVFVMVQPALAFHGSIGEVKFSIGRLINLIEGVLNE